jgi:hypothetical protein
VSRKSSGMKRHHFYLPTMLMNRLSKRSEWSGITASELARKYIEIGMETENHKYKQYELNAQGPGANKDPLIKQSEDLEETTGKSTNIQP